MSVVEAPPSREPLCEWLESGLREIAGQDPLGLQTITTDRILPGLLPGLLALSQRARYFSIYCFLLRRFQETAAGATNQALDDFLRRREFELGVAANLCEHCDADSAIGNRVVRPLVAAQLSEYPRKLSIETQLGGYGLYYRSPMEELGLVVPAGKGMVGDEPTPVDLVTERGEHLAAAFEASIESTRWLDWMHGVDPVPAELLRELAESACLCRLGEHPEEREAIRNVLLVAPSPERAEPTTMRRRALALFLDATTLDQRVIDEDGAFRETVIGAYLSREGTPAARSSSYAMWAAVSMRECMIEPFASIWHHFCRAGLQVQPFEGLTAPGLRAMIVSELLGAGTVDIAGTTLRTGPGQSALTFLAELRAAASHLSWEELGALTADADDGMSGLAVLLLLCDRIPDSAAAGTDWAAVAGVEGQHQPGLSRTARLVREELSRDPTVEELLRWIIDGFIIRVHETVAMSKLPMSTFRFYLEHARIRFVDNGVRRFNASGLRRSAMSSVAYDLGWWVRRPDGTAELTSDGLRLVEEVFPG